MIYKKVGYSTFSKILTIMVFLLLFVLSVWEIFRGQSEKGVMGAVILGIILFFSLVYAPISVMADEDYLVIRGILKRKVIPIDEIASIVYAPPTVADKRCCASGGFMGYWGWFNNKVDGNYFAYYGKSSETFLVKLRNGRKYMIGCRDSNEMADFLNDKIKTTGL